MCIRDRSKIVRYNINTNDTGDGQKMGMWIGADMDEFACGDLWPFAAVMMDGTLPTTCLLYTSRCV